MIVNCFNVFSDIFVRRDSQGRLTKTTLSRIIGALAETFELNSGATAAAFIAIETGKIDQWDPYLTGAESNLISTINAWLAAELGDTYEDAWGMKTRCTPCFVFENHNRAVGVLLRRSV